MYLVPQCPEEILHAPAIVLAEFPEILNEQPVEARVPVVADDVRRARLEREQVRVLGIAAHYLEPVRRVLEEGEPFARVPEVRMQQARAGVRSARRRGQRCVR